MCLSVGIGKGLNNFILRKKMFREYLDIWWSWKITQSDKEEMKI